MSPAPSYYDSIGLLVICDAVDAVDGIPFHPVSSPKPPPSFQKSTTLAAPPPSTDKLPKGIGKGVAPQHTLLAHIPVTGVFSPFGTIPYDEQQRMAINQLAGTGQLPQQPPAHTIGGARPSVPVAHNLHGSSGQRSRSVSISQSPSTRIGSPHMGQHGPSSLSSGQVQRPMQSPMMSRPQRSESPNIPSMPAAGHSPAPIPQSNLGSALASPGLSTAGLSNQGYASGMGPGIGQPPVLNSGMNSGMNSGLGMDNGAGLNAGYMGMPPPGPGMPAPAPLVSDSRASTPGSPLDSPQSQYRVEVCQICGRDFKGRKAATHKQQHIRRLHPAEYTPKRGGKKSRND